MIKTALYGTALGVGQSSNSSNSSSKNNRKNNHVYAIDPEATAITTTPTGTRQDG
jgi:hypothetical protein